MVDQVLMVIAVGCFGASAAGVPARVNLVSCGLCAWALAVLI